MYNKDLRYLLTTQILCSSQHTCRMYFSVGTHVIRTFNRKKTVDGVGNSILFPFLLIAEHQLPAYMLRWVSTCFKTAILGTYVGILDVQYKCVVYSRLIEYIPQYSGSHPAETQKGKSHSTVHVRTWYVYPRTVYVTHLYLHTSTYTVGILLLMPL